MNNQSMVPAKKIYELPTIRLSERMGQLLEEHAIWDGTDKSNLVRNAIAFYLISKKTLELLAKPKQLGFYEFDRKFPLDQ